jgi:very-short-patch-repair endonuclease
LNELGLHYQYSFFSKGHQFDFLVSLKKHVLIIEVDGDFWHKSKRRCKDEEARKIIRDNDEKKASIISTFKSDKYWVLLRFWEIDIYEDYETVKKFIQKLVEEEENATKFECNVQKIKIYYEKNS